MVIIVINIITKCNKAGTALHQLDLLIINHIMLLTSWPLLFYTLVLYIHLEDVKNIHVSNPWLRLIGMLEVPE